MKAATVLLARIKAGNGKFPFLPVKIKRDRPVAPDNATAYYARYSGRKPDGSTGRIVQPLGDNLEVAYTAFLNLKTANEAKRGGFEVSNAVVAAPADKGSLADAVAEYLEECAIRNSSETVASDTRILNDFRDDCLKHRVVSLSFFKDSKAGRKRLLEHIAWMKTHLATISIDGKNPENTRNKRMNRISTFFRQHGIKVKKAKNAGPDDPGLLAHHEFPAYKAQDASMYSDETIDAWKGAATVDERDIIEFFLATGFRDEEVGYIEWSDINWANKTVNVHAKARTATRPWSWTPKDGESRAVDIPLSDELIARLKARKERHAAQKCALIFPSGVCKPNEHLLRIVRRAAKRAGITERVALHTIRKTVGSNLAEKYGVVFAMDVLGHSDIKTTQNYMARNPKTLQRLRDDLNKKSA
jgi:integrase